MYKLQNRYQDSGWEDLHIKFTNEKDAIQEASVLCKDAICYGMVRVVDMVNKRVVIEFPAGG